MARIFVPKIRSVKQGERLSLRRYTSVSEVKATSEGASVAGAIVEVTDTNFQAEVVEAGEAVLVDFWAPWCGPCRIVAPHLEELNDERADMRVVKLNVDDNPETAARYNVMSIPTLLLFRNGEVAHQIVGALPKNRLVQELEPALAA
jgi:thioredoxin 1